MTSTANVYEHVKLMAMRYQFRPNERINESELSKRLNVSRTPLREALSRLSAEGFIVAEHSKGFFARALDPKEVFDLYEFRCGLESAIVRLVCERATDDELQELKRNAEHTMQRMEMLSPTDILARDEKFHLDLARLSRNAEYVRSLEAVNNRIHFVRWIDHKHRINQRTGHTDLVNKIIGRDADAAVEYLDRHIKKHYQQILDVTKSSLLHIYMGEGGETD